MATNNFKPFGIGAGANVTSQADYEALAALLSGFQSGKASSAQINKAIRQATVMSYVLAQFIANSSGNDVLDNGDTATLITSLITALKANSANDFLQTLNNLVEIKNAGTAAQASARTNLGLGNSATLNTGTAAGTVASGNDSRITGSAQKASNLSDLANAATARTNLGLGTAATATIGTAANQLPSMASFASLLSQNGWFKLPSGIIFQWGTSAPATPSNPDVLVNFPVPFPNVALAIGEHDRGGSTAMTFWQINNLAQSGFYASAIGSMQRGNIQVGPVPQSAGCQWWAWGY